MISLYHGICHFPPVAICQVFIIQEAQNTICAQVYIVKTTDNNINSDAHDTTFLKSEVFLAVFILIYFQQDATLHGLFISGKLLYMFRVVSAPIIRNTQLYLQYLVLVNRYCYLPL